MDEADIEIVGLKNSSNGRSCGVHAICGEDVGPGDVLRLVPCVIFVGDTPENAVKAVKVVDGMDSCTVGFVPRAQAKLKKVRDHHNKFVTVKELYEDSGNSYKRSKDRSNYGMASVAFLDENDGRVE